MPDLTPIYGLPYPVGTDLIMDGDDAIRALAERLEEVLDAASIPPPAPLQTGEDTP